MSEATRIGSASMAADTTRQRLLDAATEVFLEKGYEGTRVAEIARRAGLTTGAIYGNFESKADLLSAALAAGCSVDESSVAGALAREPAAKHRLFLDLLALAPRDATAAAAVETAFDAARSEIERLVKAMTDRVQTADVTPEAMCTALELMTLGAIVTQALGRELPSAPDVAHVLRVAAEVVGDTP